MDKFKKIIIIVIVIALSLSVVLLTMILNNLKQVDNIGGNDINYEDYQGAYVPKVEIKQVSNKNKYFAIKNIVETYISYLSDDKAGTKALQGILAPGYKSEFNITNENIKSNLSKFAGSEIYIENMYEQEKSESVSLIILEGRTKTTNVDFNIIVKIDSLNQAFEIYPEEFMNKYGYNDLEKIATINVIGAEALTKNEYNAFSYKNISNKQMCNYYLEDYVYNVTTNIENAYNLLDEEYREARFGSLDAYKSYVYTNLNSIKNVELAEYANVNYNNYKQYVCIDTEGKYYLFRETAVMEYTLLLDTYTVILPEFLEKYDNANNMEKVALNINNFIQAINDENYGYAYNVLNQTFKSNKFSNKSDFENHIKNKLFNNNKVEFVEYNLENDTHIYSLDITDANSENSNKISMTVIMQLGKGTDFTMSFSIN